MFILTHGKNLKLTFVRERSDVPVFREADEILPRTVLAFPFREICEVGRAPGFSDITGSLHHEHRRTYGPAVHGFDGDYRSLLIALEFLENHDHIPAVAGLTPLLAADEFHRRFFGQLGLNRPSDCRSVWDVPELWPLLRFERRTVGSQGTAGRC